MVSPRLFHLYQNNSRPKCLSKCAHRWITIGLIGFHRPADDVVEWPIQGPSLPRTGLEGALPIHILDVCMGVGPEQVQDQGAKGKNVRPAVDFRPRTYSSGAFSRFVPQKSGPM